MAQAFKLSSSAIIDHISRLQKLMHAQGISHCYISATDAYLNEYVPLEGCRRYQLTGFSGSTGDALVAVSGQVQLFVDGRYHEQADQEVVEGYVQVVKVGPKQGMREALLEQIPQTAHVGYEALRTPLALAQKIAGRCQAITAQDQELAALFPPADSAPLPRVKNLERAVDICPVGEKLSRLYCGDGGYGQEQALYLSALDQIAWLSNLRGYHLPHLSSFLARAIVTPHQLHLFVPPAMTFEPLSPHIQLHQVADEQWPAALAALKGQWRTLFFDQQAINAHDHQVLCQVLGPENVEHKAHGLIPWMSIKDPKEVKLMQRAFEQSNQAITDVLRWLRSSMARGEEVSELDVYHKTEWCYRQQGAQALSFNTIAGVGPHSSIIHFSSPEAGIKIAPSDVVLLDSGGYFAGGFATDTTRTILAHGQAQADPLMVEIFSVALKAMLRLQNAVVKAGSLGRELDAIARTPIQEAGYDYNHGTGHGVGVYVHEGGISFSVRSPDHHRVQAGQVVSIEPGIYLPGVGGVRHENIALVCPHREKSGYVFFQPLTWIAFDEQLLDRSRLSEQELQWFEDYQAQARSRGCGF